MPVGDEPAEAASVAASEESQPEESLHGQAQGQDSANYAQSPRPPRSQISRATAMLGGALGERTSAVLSMQSGEDGTALSAAEVAGEHTSQPPMLNGPPLPLPLLRVINQGQADEAAQSPPGSISPVYRANSLVSHTTAPSKLAARRLQAEAAAALGIPPGASPRNSRSELNILAAAAGNHPTRMHQLRAHNAVSSGIPTLPLQRIRSQQQQKGVAGGTNQPSLSQSQSQAAAGAVLPSTVGVALGAASQAGGLAHHTPNVHGLPPLAQPSGSVAAPRHSAAGQTPVNNARLGMPVGAHAARIARTATAAGQSPPTIAPQQLINHAATHQPMQDVQQTPTAPAQASIITQPAVAQADKAAAVALGQQPAGSAVEAGSGDHHQPPAAALSACSLPSLVGASIIEGQHLTAPFNQQGQMLVIPPALVALVSAKQEMQTSNAAVNAGSGMMPDDQQQQQRRPSAAVLQPPTREQQQQAPAVAEQQHAHISGDVNMEDAEEEVKQQHHPEDEHVQQRIGGGAHRPPIPPPTAAAAQITNAPFTAIAAAASRPPAKQAKVATGAGGGGGPDQPAASVMAAVITTSAKTGGSSEMQQEVSGANASPAPPAHAIDNAAHAAPSSMAVMSTGMADVDGSVDMSLHAGDDDAAGQQGEAGAVNQRRPSQKRKQQVKNDQEPKRQQQATGHQEQQQQPVPAARMGGGNSQGTAQGTIVAPAQSVLTTAGVGETDQADDKGEAASPNVAAKAAAQAAAANAAPTTGTLLVEGSAEPGGAGGAPNAAGGGDGSLSAPPAVRLAQQAIAEGIPPLNTNHCLLRSQRQAAVPSTIAVSIGAGNDEDWQNTLLSGQTEPKERDGTHQGAEPMDASDGLPEGGIAPPPPVGEDGGNGENITEMGNGKHANAARSAINEQYAGSPTDRELTSPSRATQASSPASKQKAGSKRTARK